MANDDVMIRVNQEFVDHLLDKVAAYQRSVRFLLEGVHADRITTVTGLGVCIDDVPVPEDIFTILRRTSVEIEADRVARLAAAAASSG